MKVERFLRWSILLVCLAIPLVVLIVRWIDSRGIVEIHARMPEQGGWQPSDLIATAGEPLHLRLTSDDVLHGFAVGQSDIPDVEIKPGEISELTLVFDKPGKYTTYCTRWCGVNHWRMRGTIEVLPNPDDPVQTNSSATVEDIVQPLFVQLGLELDAPRHTTRLPVDTPSAVRAASISLEAPAALTQPDFYRLHSPVEAWEILRNEPALAELSDQQVWDQVALFWYRNTTPEQLASSASLYADNCAACHGEKGAGDGVMAEQVRQDYPSANGHSPAGPSDFTDPSRMLATSPAILHGKLVRGGMGTGMPYWGPIFTDDQLWGLVSYLWSFQFEFLRR